MLVDLTRMKKPSYVITDERNWRASVRQPSQPDPAEFFGNIMNEYEKVRVLCYCVDGFMIISYHCLH